MQPTAPVAASLAQGCLGGDVLVWLNSVGVVPNTTAGDLMWTMPGMKKGLYHWQWHRIFTVVQVNSGQNDIFGRLIGDEMGLGKVIDIKLRDRLNG